MTGGTYTLVGNINLCIWNNCKYYRTAYIFRNELHETDHEYQNISKERSVWIQEIKKISLERIRLGFNVDRPIM